MPPVKKPQQSRPQNKLKPKIVLYSLSGLGKSSFAAQWSRPGFLCDSQERGIEYLAQAGRVPEPVWVDSDFDCTSEKSWPRLKRRIEESARDSSIDTLVVESITGIERMGFKYHCHERFKGDDLEYYSYWRGPKQFSRFVFPDLLETLDIVSACGKNVIVTAHATKKQTTDPEGVEYLQWQPYCEDDTWNPLHRWASFVLFIGSHIEQDREKKGLKKVAKDISKRLMYLGGTPYCAAKNWYGLTGVIGMGDSPQEGYNNFIDKAGEYI